jgi:hypothetical protein
MMETSKDEISKDKGRQKRRVSNICNFEKKNQTVNLYAYSQGVRFESRPRHKLDRQFIRGLPQSLHGNSGILTQIASQTLHVTPWHYKIQWPTYDSTKTLITNKCTKRVLSSIVTHFYMFRPCWVIFREKFFVIVTLRLHFIVEWECAVDCVLCTGGVNSLWSRPERSTQSTAHSHSTLKCNLTVPITKRSPWRWSSRVETCGSVLQLTIKLSLWICWWLVFLYNIVHGHGTH